MNYKQVFHHLEILQIAIVTGFLLFLVGCVESPKPTSEELTKILPPTFAGAEQQIFTSPSSNYVLSGECDPRSFGIEYSTDQTNWVTLQSGCPTGTFSLTVNVTSQKIIYARAKTKMGYTSSCEAIVRFALPPTTGTYQFVAAGRAFDSGGGGIDFTMSVLSGNTQSNTHYRMNSNTTGIVYGGP